MEAAIKVQGSYSVGFEVFNEKRITRNTGL
jgi:hypothetical protein